MPSARTFSVILLIACASAQTNDADRLTKGEQVLTRFVLAIGGTAAYDGITTRSSNGYILDWQGKRLTFERHFKFPDKYLSIEHGAKSDIRQGYDGKTEWIQEGKHKPRHVTRSYDTANDMSFHDVVHWKDAFKKYDFRGEADVLNRKTYVL